MLNSAPILVAAIAEAAAAQFKEPFGDITLPAKRRWVTTARQVGTAKEDQYLAHGIPPRKARRRSAKRLGVLAGWREGKNRYVRVNGQHVVVWPIRGQ